ncbi:helix-turn-helix transcriptional regulator [Brevibacillus agri]|uniref:helix-turn-helix domain-containing protein n=1 Tax=Brevibacillus agri TaxID=51101 RepID=UPI002E1EB40B|nr:helix-turn-helix transcriptional regulator [Brevibacillus agri]MED1653872.1 helix-turn-helix transcriptional regulator [Brevibacillus agri]MED1686711.1 helix-turn-helix transcriptional regulator [Brevibacillus agri]MED1691970.1 helix-turn-helix transcriptional regulator [Brevibacillus agri]MED1696027.1 helix-turn-helix transcriptional regulator [Brevibacillus agri]
MDENQKRLMGQRIKSLREKQGLSQDELASRLGMNRTNVSNYESGRTVPPGNVIRALADLLKTNADYLLGRSDNAHPLDINKMDDLDDDIRAIQRAAKNMSTKDRKKMLSMIKLAFEDAFDEEDEDEDDL